MATPDNRVSILRPLDALCQMQYNETHSDCPDKDCPRGNKNNTEFQIDSGFHHDLMYNSHMPLSHTWTFARDCPLLSMYVCNVLHSHTRWCCQARNLPLKSVKVSIQAKSARYVLVFSLIFLRVFQKKHPLGYAHYMYMHFRMAMALKEKSWLSIWFWTKFSHWRDMTLCLTRRIFKTTKYVLKSQSDGSHYKLFTGTVLNTHFCCNSNKKFWMSNKWSKVRMWKNLTCTKVPPRLSCSTRYIAA